MFKSPFPYFAVIAVLAVGGVDYFNQAKKAGPDIGAYSFGAYTDSIKSRIADMRSARDAARDKAERQAALAKLHLPQAPEGWERREWTPELSDTFSDGTENDLEATVTTALDDNAAMRALNGVMNSKVRKAAKDEVWEYVGPYGTIRLSAEYTPHSGRLLSEKILMDPRGSGVVNRHGVPVKLGVIRGVTFYFKKRDLYDSAGTYPGSAPIYLIAPMGQDVKLTAYAETDPQMLMHLLERIDYDALNAMMDTPAQDVGSAAPDLTDKERQAMVATLQTAMMDRLKNKIELAVDQAASQAAIQRLTAKSDDRQDENSVLERLFNKDGQTDANAGNGTAKAKPEAAAPKRLKLSGGRSCLDGSSGKLCGD